MKKVVVIVLAVCSSIASLAQNTFVPTIGLASTYNTNSINGYNAKSGIGFMGGLGYSMPLSKRLSFQPEVYFIQKSFTMDFEDHEKYDNGQIRYSTDATYHDKYKANYLDIPLLLRYSFMDGKIFAIAGPYLSIGMSGSHSYSYTTINTTNDVPITQSASGSDNLHFGSAPSGTTSHRAFQRKVDSGLSIGAGYKYDKFIIQLRYEQGLVNVWKGRDSRNESLILSVAYPFSLRSAEE